MWHALATYSDASGAPRTALVVDNRLYDVATLRRAFGEALPAVLAAGVAEAVAGWDDHAPAIAACAARIPAADVAPLASGSFRLRAPYRPARIFATASNFYEHAREMGTELAPRAESSPYVFIKAETSVADPDQPVVKPGSVQRLDWEVELGVVIGRGGRHIGVDAALEHVAGYVVFNDVSARDLTRRTDYPFSHDWFRGKSFDTFGPMGPWLVPRDCLGDPQAMRMRLAVNGELMQDGSTSEMIFSVAEQIAYLSEILTLKPGDLIATGTPTGVGMGRGVYLKPGDVMVASIDGIGAITNPVVAA